jgi:hypothetical protein
VAQELVELPLEEVFRTHAAPLSGFLNRKYHFKSLVSTV